MQRKRTIIKTSKSNKGLSNELIVLMYLLIVVLDKPRPVAALPIESNSVISPILCIMSDLLIVPADRIEALNTLILILF